MHKFLNQWLHSFKLKLYRRCLSDNVQWQKKQNPRTEHYLVILSQWYPLDKSVCILNISPSSTGKFLRLQEPVVTKLSKASMR